MQNLFSSDFRQLPQKYTISTHVHINTSDTQLICVIYKLSVNFLVLLALHRSLICFFNKQINVYKEIRGAVGTFCAFRRPGFCFI